MLRVSKSLLFIQHKNILCLSGVEQWQDHSNSVFIEDAIKTAGAKTNIYLIIERFVIFLSLKVHFYFVYFLKVYKIYLKEKD